MQIELLILILTVPQGATISNRIILVEARTAAMVALWSTRKAEVYKLVEHLGRAI